RRDHVRDEELRGGGPGRRRPPDYREESRHRGDRSPHAAGRVAGGSGDAGTPGAEGHPGRTADPLVRLRDGPRRHEPAPRVLQDGFARPGRQRGEKGARSSGDRGAGRRSQVLIDTDNITRGRWGRWAGPTRLAGAEMINAALVG